MGTDVPQNQELAKAFDVADKLATLEGTHYPDEFLVDLHETAPALFQEFSQVKDFTASQPETVALLAELDGMLQDFELREKTKDSVAFKDEMLRLGLTDELLSKFCVALSANTELYGEPYANTELIPSGYSASYSTDKEIAQMIAGRYKKVEDLIGAYQKLELDPSQNNEARIVRESVDFLRVKAPAFISLHTQSRTERDTKAKEAAQAASEKTAHEKAIDGYLGVYADTSTEDFVAQTEPLLREFVDYGNAAQGVDFSEQLKTAQLELEAASTDVARGEADLKIREICAAILVEDDQLKPLSTPTAPVVATAQDAPTSTTVDVPAAAPKARRHPGVVMASGPQGGDAAEEAAEEPVDYREDAKANPDQYKSEVTGNAGKGSFKFDTRDNFDADIAIRIEDLMGDQRDLVLTSPRFGSLEFKYNADGVDGKGASWYAGKQRLIIRSGDTISYEKSESAAVATVEAPAAVVLAPGEPAAVVAAPPAAPVEVKKPPTADEVEAGKQLLAAATTARDKVEELEAVRTRWASRKESPEKTTAIAAADTALAEAYRNFDGAMTALKEGYVGDSYDLVAKNLRLTAGQERAVAFFKASPTKAPGTTDSVLASTLEDDEELDIDGGPSPAVVATAAPAAPVGVADAGAIPSIPKG